MNPLYEFVSELKNRIAAGEISGYTALDLFYQRVSSPVPDALWDQRAEHSFQPDAADPVPEPASEEPADGQTAEPETE